MSEQRDLLRITRDYLLAGQLVLPGQYVVAAVSGGRDSCVMLHLLHSLSRELGFTLAVAHFDHQLRPASAAEQQFVQELAGSFDLPFYGGCADVRALARGENLEDTARRARYAFLRETAHNIGAASIATAHHVQDQAETVLLHLLRGSGLEGLAAMAPSEGGIIRPLLSALPEQIEDYRAAHNISFCQDESNADPRYLRNHIRLNLLPQLQALNPRLLQSLSATADICREDNAALNSQAKAALDELWLSDSCAIAQGYFNLQPALQRRLVRLAFTQISGEELSFAQTEAARALKEEQSLSCPGGWLIYRRGALFIGQEQQSLPNHPEVIPLETDGAWHILAGWGWEYMAIDASRGSNIVAQCKDNIFLPAGMAGGLYFRTRRAGDAVPSAGKAGRRKVKDIFIDAKIPPYLRAGWPLLCAGDEVVWLPRLSKCAYKTEEAMLLIFTRRTAEDNIHTTAEKHGE
jgi:tRNA(Ile)-lysidine synthase